VRCERLQDSGPYVLGALSPSEREDYERHLAMCAECRQEVADLAELPMLLGRLDLSTAQAVAAGGEDGVRAVLEAMPTSREPRWAGPTMPVGWAGPTAVPPGPASTTARDPLLPRVLERTSKQRRTERRRRRWQSVGAAVAAACLGALALFGVRVATQPHLNNMQMAAADTPVTASVAIDTDDDGTIVVIHCEYRESASLDSREWTLKLVAVPKAGTAENVGTWTAGHGDEYDMITHTRFKRSEIARVEVQDDKGKPLLRYNVA
jgi:anti-sigma-K factor RskA